ncbi:hypothetical protein N9064_00665 [bacterium]|nr:hypothetical protein [bacterium]
MPTPRRQSNYTTPNYTTTGSNNLNNTSGQTTVNSGNFAAPVNNSYLSGGNNYIDPNDPNYYNQISQGTQTGSSHDTGTQNSTSRSAFETTETGQQFTSSLTQEQQQQFEQLLSQTLSSMTSTSNQQSTGSTSVTDPFGFLALLQQEQGFLDDDTLQGTQALRDLVAGQGLPTVDRQAYLDLQQEAIRTALAKSGKGPTALGVGGTDLDRMGSSAVSQAALPFSQSLLQAENDANINSLAARVQGAESLRQGTASSDLFKAVAPSLTSLFGTQTTGTQSGQTSEQTSTQVNQTISSMLTRASQASETINTIGTAVGWDEKQIEAVTEAWSDSIAASQGYMSGISPEGGGGGKFICTVLCHLGLLDEAKLKKEVKWFTRNLSRLKWSARGYLAVGPRMAKFTLNHPKLAKLITPFVNQIVTCTSDLESRKSPSLLSLGCFGLVRFCFAIVGLLGFNKGKVDSEILSIMQEYYNPVNVDNLYKMKGFKSE